MRETVVEAYLREQIKSRGGLCLKWVSPGYTGVPDRIILMQGGRIAFAETKATNKTEGSRQRRVQDILRGLGCKVYSTVDSKEAVDMLIEDMRGGVT